MLSIRDFKSTAALDGVYGKTLNVEARTLRVVSRNRRENTEVGWFFNVKLFDEANQSVDVFHVRHGTETDSQNPSRSSIKHVVVISTAQARGI